MIRIWFTPQMDYQSFRVEYVRRLVTCHALRIDDKQVLRSLFQIQDQDATDKELKTKYMDGHNFGRTHIKRNDLEIIPGLQSMLFHRDGTINREGLLLLLAGPEVPPNCVARTALPQGQLRPLYQILHRNITKGMAQKNADEAMNLCKYIFDYDKIQDAAYWLLDQLQVRTCPYCNRVYTTHFRSTGIRSTGIRPSLDHFFPKSKHPYFALSLFNLVPSCDYCNRTKGDGKEELTVCPDLEDNQNKWLIYPYDECYNDKCGLASFQMVEIDQKHQNFWKALRGENGDFKLIIHIHNEGKAERRQQIRNNLNEMGIETIYSRSHWQEVQKLARLHYWYSHTYIESVLSIVFGEDWNKLNPFTCRTLLERSKELLYYADLDPENWGNAPLNKLKADILTQLDEYEQAGKESTHSREDEEGDTV